MGFLFLRFPPHCLFQQQFSAYGVLFCFFPIVAFFNNNSQPSTILSLRQYSAYGFFFLLFPLVVSIENYLRSTAISRRSQMSVTDRVSGPSTTTSDILETGHNLSFVFNIECLLEVGFGLFRKHLGVQVSVKLCEARGQT